MEATEIREQAAQIATSLAAGLLSWEEVPEHFRVDAGEWEKFRFSPYFKRIYNEQRSIWSGDVNSPKRSRLKCQAMLEDSLPVLHRIIHDENLHPSNRLEAFKQTARLAGAEQELDPQKGAALGPAVHLEINIGTEDGVQTISLGRSADPSLRTVRNEDLIEGPIIDHNEDLRANFDEPTED